MTDNLRDRIAAAITAAINRSDMPPPEQISGCSDSECCDPVYDYNVEDVSLQIADTITDLLIDMAGQGELLKAIDRMYRHD
jgi:hypothetical protein